MMTTATHEDQTESREPPTWPGSIEPSLDARVILVAVGWGDSSRAALSCAKQLARAMGFSLRLVHATPVPITTNVTSGPTSSQPSFDRSRWLDWIKEAVQAWATFEAEVKVPSAAIRTRYGEPLEIILQEAAACDVVMTVVGWGAEVRTGFRGEMLHALLRRSAGPLLFAGPRAARPIVVAATDCSDPSLPVLRKAWTLASALGAQLRVVHNVDAVASQFSKRIGMPLSPEQADRLAQHSQKWLSQLAPPGEILITREAINARGVLDAVQTLDAEFLVAGVKPSSLAQQKTADSILDDARGSVLFVPLGQKSASAFLE